MSFQRVNSEHGVCIIYLLKRQTYHCVHFPQFISLYERWAPFFHSIHINETNTLVPNDFIFTLRSLNRIVALLFLFITLEKYLAVATTRSHFNLYETQFCSPTKGVISFRLMARKKFRKRSCALFYRIIRGNAGYSFPN